MISSKSLSEMRDSFSSDAMEALGASSALGLAAGAEKEDAGAGRDAALAAGFAPPVALSSDFKPVAMTVTLMVSSKVRLTLLTIWQCPSI